MSITITACDSLQGLIEQHVCWRSEVTARIPLTQTYSDSFSDQQATQHQKGLEHNLTFFRLSKWDKTNSNSFPARCQLTGAQTQCECYLGANELMFYPPGFLLKNEVCLAWLLIHTTHNPPLTGGQLMTWAGCLNFSWEFQAGQWTLLDVKVSWVPYEPTARCTLDCSKATL